jgi:hypothetical protein
MKVTGALTHSLIAVLLALSAPSAAPVQPDAEAEGAIELPRIIPKCRIGGEEIVVCGRPLRSPYRLPEPPPGFDPGAGVSSVSRERNALFDVGETGIGSCSNVGAGGPFGCTFKQWKHAEQQNQGHSSQKGLIRKFQERETPEPFPEE